MRRFLETNQVFYSWLLLLSLALIWGSSFILMKKGLEVFSAGEVGAVRIISAAAVLLPFSLPALKNLRRAHWKLLFLSGLVGSFLPAFLFATAQTQLSSSLTGILNALTPLFVLILGVFFFKQNLTRKNLAGITVGFGGSFLLVFSGSSDAFWYSINFFTLLVVLATVFYGTNLNLIKHYLQDLSPGVITSVSLLLVGPLALAYLFSMTDFTARFYNAAPALQSLSFILILGVIGTGFALVIFNKLVQLTTPVFTSTVTYLIPVVAVAWGLLDGEKILPSHLIGMVTIIFSIYIINSGKKRIFNNLIQNFSVI
jgi:drug/metabolite transporter (DMT)-like permease